VLHYLHCVLGISELEQLSHIMLKQKVTVNKHSPSLVIAEMWHQESSKTEFSAGALVSVSDIEVLFSQFWLFDEMYVYWYAGMFDDAVCANFGGFGFTTVPTYVDTEWLSH
jgi:hypothetical protein